VRRSNRPKTPTVLQGRSQEYGKRYADRLDEAEQKRTAAAVKAKATGEKAETIKTPMFSWPTIKGITLNQHLLPALKRMTDEHCAFCDAHPVEGVSNETIDHFRPKSKFPKLCCYWSNLYYACDCCQGHKLERFEPALLRPDASDYDFDRYFIYDHASGEIQINTAATSDDQHRADRTIELLGLNKSGRPKTRKREARIFNEKTRTDDERREWAYRFALD